MRAGAGADLEFQLLQLGVVVGGGLLLAAHKPQCFRQVDQFVVGTNAAVACIVEHRCVPPRTIILARSMRRSDGFT